MMAYNSIIPCIIPPYIFSMGYLLLLYAIIPHMLLHIIQSLIFGKEDEMKKKRMDMMMVLMISHNLQHYKHSQPSLHVAIVYMCKLIN